MKLTQPKAILFDWDNTLVDTWPTIHSALNETMRFMGHPEWSIDKVKKNVKKSMRESFPHLFSDDWEKAAEHYQRTYRATHTNTLKPLPGAEDLLHLLQDHDLFLAVVSNKKSITLREEIKHLRWDDFFDVIVGADDAARDKPHPDPVLLALKTFGDEFGPEVWFVGDTAVDLECAQVTGCTPILYGDHVTEGQMHDGFSFAVQVHDHAALRKLIIDHASATDAA